MILISGALFVGISLWCWWSFIQIVLAKKKGILYEKDSMYRYGFIILGFKKEYYWWDVIIWMRKTLWCLFYITL